MQHLDYLTDLQNNLALDDKAISNGTQVPPPTLDQPPRTENIPPPTRTFGPSLQHQLKSKELDQQRLRTGARPGGPPPPLNVFADPPRTGARPRRNSDSSLADKNGKVLSSDEERKRRERRHREREMRHRDRDRDGRPRPGGPKKQSRKLDVIDQLDLSSIYGTGCKQSSS